MAPGILPGDRVLVDRGAYRRAAPVPGDLVALTDPQAPARSLLKRVAVVGPGRFLLPVPGLGPEETPAVGVPAGTVFLLSDAPEGRDSRRFGPVARASVQGKVWFRYGPRGRRGPLVGPS